jgi:hypothetical protein
MIQQLLDATPAGGTCVIPPGVYDVPERTKLTVPNTVERIIGDGATVRVVDANGNQSTLTPTMSLFECGNRLTPGSRLEVRGLTIIGPDTTGWDLNADIPHSAINWTYYKTWDSTLIIDGCTITGGYGYAVQRSGGGRLDIHNSSLSGWVGGVAFFEGHGGHGSMLVRNTTMPAPTHSKYSSIGAYIHPHLDVTWDNVTATGWNRYAVYLNGTPQSAGNHTLIDVTATDCSLIQTGSSSETTLVRCVEQGTPKNGGSFFKGPVLSCGTRWAGAGMISFLSGNAPARRFVRDTIATPKTWIAAGTGTAGSILLNDCTLELTAKTQAVKLTNQSTVAVKVVSSGFTGTSTVFTFNAEGGTLRFVDCPPFPNVRAVAPGVLLP